MAGSSTHVYNSKNVKKYEQQDKQIIIKIACPSCIKLFDTQAEVALHVDSNHIKLKVATSNLPQQSNRWILSDEDISMKFHRYRNSCIRALSTTTFSIETHFNELLAMSGIVALQRRCNYESIPPEDVAPALLQAARTVNLAKFTRASFRPHLQSQEKH
jgi:uncharacterized C2H2 Zn-finger protein